MRTPLFNQVGQLRTPLFNQVGQLRTPLFNQVGQLRTSSHLQLRPGQDKAKQCDKNNDTELHMGLTNVHSIEIEKNICTVCVNVVRLGREGNK